MARYGLLLLVLVIFVGCDWRPPRDCDDYRLLTYREKSPHTGWGSIETRLVCVIAEKPVAAGEPAYVFGLKTEQ